MACRVQLDGTWGRRACAKCNKCYPATSERSDLCPDCQRKEAREDQYLRAKAKRTGGHAGTLFAVQFEGRKWELPMDELTATIELGNFPPTVPVEWRGRVGRVVKVGDGWKWKAAR